MIKKKDLEGLFIGNFEEEESEAILKRIEDSFPGDWRIEANDDKINFLSPTMTFDINKIYEGFNTKDYFGQSNLIFNPISVFCEEIDIYFEKKNMDLYSMCVKTYAGEYRGGYNSIDDELLDESNFDMTLDDIVEFINNQALEDTSYKLKEINFLDACEEVDSMKFHFNFVDRLLKIKDSTIRKDLKRYDYILEEKFQFSSWTEKRYVALDSFDAEKIKEFMEEEEKENYVEFVKNLFQWK